MPARQQTPSEPLPQATCALHLLVTRSTLRLQPPQRAPPHTLIMSPPPPGAHQVVALRVVLPHKRRAPLQHGARLRQHVVRVVRHGQLVQGEAQLRGVRGYGLLEGGRDVFECGWLVVG
jgi:hypothetical protein